jgi:integrase
MARKGENIYKRKDGRWEGRYQKRIPGQKPVYGYIYAKTYREARVKLRAAATQWESQQAQIIEPEPLLLSTVALEWEHYIAPQVKQSTIVRYHTILAKHLIPAMGNTSVLDMTHRKIEEFSRELLNTLAPRTVSDILSVLRSILRYAQRGGAEVPCDGSSVRIRRPPVEIRVLTPNEQTKLCSYLFHDLSLRNAGILLSLYTGLRVGEVCALKWEDFALEDHLLYVRRTMQRLKNLSSDGPKTMVVETPPKSVSSARTIPLPEELVCMLLSLPGPHEGYFLTGSMTQFVEPRMMQYHFERVVAACGIEYANYHALRHTFATRCVELGFDAKSLSELLGHATVGMTLDRYVHPTMEHKRAHMQRLSNQIAVQFAEQ